ncbi:MAG: (2Fe-2S) ferredoxin domain-containing protein [Clostridiales bacterium]|nr:(2Fe-2S) ferredoxin domain-containing protein [Clostridiales bacterium]
MKTLEELKQLKEETLKKISLDGVDNGIRIVVGMATCGIAAGAKPVFAAIKDEVDKRNLKNVEVHMTGCIGICRFEPIVEIHTMDGNKTTYVYMTDEKARKMIEEHIVKGKIVYEYTIGAYEK